MLDPQLNDVLAKERAIMNNFAATYHNNPAFSSYFYEQERKLFMNWVLGTLRDAGADPQRCAVLETGISTGSNLVLMQQAGYTNLAGIDIAEDMLAVAQQRLPGARMIHGAIETHDFGGERFDVIIGAYTVHHLKRPRAFFEMADRVIKPGGRIFLLEYEASGWANAAWSRPWVEMSAAPMRCFLKWKNRKRLPQPSDYPAADFNPAHRLLTYRQIVEALASPEHYTCTRRTTRGVWLPAFNYALAESSRLDRLLYELLDAIDRIAVPFNAGNLQWILIQRKQN